MLPSYSIKEEKLNNNTVQIKGNLNTTEQIYEILVIIRGIVRGEYGN